MIFSLQSGCENTVEMAMFNVQRAITPKAGKPDLRFMFPACRFIVLYIYVKCHENISKGIRDGADTNDGNADRRTDRWPLKILEGVT